MTLTKTICRRKMQGSHRAIVPAVLSGLAVKTIDVVEPEK
jgi:hypothetical protein